MFTIPKAFVGHIEIIQANAIESWLRLEPACEVTLFGDEGGTASYANKFGIRHVPGVAVNEYGTPLLNDVFSRAHAGARFPILCYVNADIILPAQFPQAIARIPFEKFLMIGQRVDVDVQERIEFTQTSAGQECDRQLLARGKLHPPLGSDYFVFPKGSIGQLPAFAVGRPGWDNWMISHALRQGVPVVDASSATLAIHQNHDYAHVPGGSGKTYNGPEGDQNRKMIGQADQILSPVDANWRLTRDRLHRAPWTVERVGRKMRVKGPEVPVLGPTVARAGVFLERVGRRLGRGLFK